jgi:thioredoxin-like negative regulator of GroEL
MKAEETTVEYLEEYVVKMDSEPHVVYVTAEDDGYRPYLLPTLEEVCEEIDSSIELVIVDADKDEFYPFCSKAQVLLFPTILFFRKGKLVTTVAGFIPKENLLKIARDAAEPTTAEKVMELAREAAEAAEERRKAERQG